MRDSIGVLLRALSIAAHLPVSENEALESFASTLRQLDAAFHSVYEDRGLAVLNN